MSQRELIYYIDPNSSLYNSRDLIGRYVNDYLSDKARMATSEDYENLICLTAESAKPRRNKYRFKHISNQILYNMLINHNSVKVTGEELVECLRMALSKDKEGAVMGAHIIIKGALKEMVVSYTDTFVSNMACWVVQYRNFNDDFSRIYKLSLKEHFQEKVSNFLNTILRKDYINKNDAAPYTTTTKGMIAYIPVDRTKTLVYQLGTIVSDYYKNLEPK